LFIALDARQQHEEREDNWALELGSNLYKRCFPDSMAPVLETGK
jgi:hypothetical protein